MVRSLYDAEPEGPPRAAVVVIQEAFGVNGHIENVTRRFAAAGYRAVAPHLFHRSGDPVLDYSNFEAVMPHMGALSEAGLVCDLDATLAHLVAAGFGLSQVGVVGFCMRGPYPSSPTQSMGSARRSPSTGAGWRRAASA